MFLRIIIYSFVLILHAQCLKPEKCDLLGYMTEVQTWVDDKGQLIYTVERQTSIDLSANPNPVPLLRQQLNLMRNTVHVRYLSMARCKLTRIPTVFQYLDTAGRYLAETVEYMTFYGNSFQDISSPGVLYDVSMNATRARERLVGVGYQKPSNAVWSTGLRFIIFPHLKELDLRACSIQVLSGHVFQGMARLEALYIGENQIVHVDANAFFGLDNLIHLDFSRNEAYDDIGNLKTLTTETIYVLEHLKNLSSLDMSYTKMSNRQASMFKILGPKLSRLSLCDTGLADLDEDFFNRTSLRILDVSDNTGILSRDGVLRGLENTLEVMYAKEIGLRTADIFKGFQNLEVLVVTANDISSFDYELAETLTSLRVLVLNKNRLTTWFGRTFSLMENLEFLSLKDNNINVISEEILQDVAHVSYLALSGNFIVCNCHARDFIDLARRNEQNRKEKYFDNEETFEKHPMVFYHRAYLDINNEIEDRGRVYVNCTGDKTCTDDLNENVEGNFLLLDFYPSTYMCLRVQESRSIVFSEEVSCNRLQRIDYDKVMASSRNMLYFLLVLPILLVILGVTFLFRRNIRYFYITLRNSALLSLINKDKVIDEDVIFHYDVFVSYCNEDRYWVLDHLLPQVERDCSISACLHERDFQVGHSILENIVSCMDRSRSIMLIISHKFLLSQWCQFEMHLAQHRLLETRREDLTLVLLEEVPRRLRPNTLHYLMLTKTYIVWPKEEKDRPLFWKRLKKSLVTIKMRQTGVEASTA